MGGNDERSLLAVITGTGNYISGAVQPRRPSKAFQLCAEPLGALLFEERWSRYPGNPEMLLIDPRAFARKPLTRRGEWRQPCQLLNTPNLWRVSFEL